MPSGKGLHNVGPSDVRVAVEAFNQKFRDMEKVLWHLSREAASALLARTRSPAIEVLVWTIRSWWGIQGVTKELKVIAADTLLQFDWEPDYFERTVTLDAESERWAVNRVVDFIDCMMAREVPRREWSLASKVLHWLMPWRVPAYSGFVRRAVGISSTADPRDAYWMIVKSEYYLARQLMTQEEEWLGDIEPKSPFRALDKYLWWVGGGSTSPAVVVKNPWRVLDSLKTR